MYANISTKLVGAIRSTYTNTTSKIRTKGIESDWLEITDRCLRDIGPGMYGEETIMYADNVAAIADSITDIQEVANRWWCGMKANGMKVNIAKGRTELVVVGRIPELHEIYRDDYEINQTEYYCHLRVGIGKRIYRKLNHTAE